MSDKKTVLIVTDGAEKTVKMAKIIAGALKGNKVQIREACEFVGTDLLPADVLFIGCEEPSLKSFDNLYEMLQHINLAGRTCGLFSPSKKAGQYLKTMIKSSEAALNAELLSSEKSDEILEWTAKVITK